MNEKTLTQIVETHGEEKYEKDITTFRGYAEYMLLPDPTYIKLSSETADIATDAVNRGLDIWKVYKALCSDYKYDEQSREFVEFPDAETAKPIIDAMLNAENISQEKHSVEAWASADYGMQMQ